MSPDVVPNQNETKEHRASPDPGGFVRAPRRPRSWETAGFQTHLPKVDSILSSTGSPGSLVCNWGSTFCSLEESEFPGMASNFCL